MTTDPPAPAPQRSFLLRNWVTLFGGVIALGSLFSFLLLLLLDVLAHSANPYIGILTYLVAPSFLALGTFLAVLGILLGRLKLRRAGSAALPLRIDLTRPRDRRLIGFFLGGAVSF